VPGMPVERIANGLGRALLELLKSAPRSTPGNMSIEIPLLRELLPFLPSQPLATQRPTRCHHVPTEAGVPTGSRGGLTLEVGLPMVSRLIGVEAQQIGSG
jgi:hypothetical protein